MTIQDIAKLAGVSTSTVSKVMNGKDKDISEETKKKVLKIIEEQKYVPYFRFREKEGLKSHLIGLILKKDNREREEIVLSAEQTAQQYGYSLIICYVDTPEDIEKNIEQLAQKKVAGILIDSKISVLPQYFQHTSIYLEADKPLFSRNRITFYYRLSDASRLATERLQIDGHEKIACIYPNNEKAICDGYETAMRRKNLPIQPLWEYEVNSLDEIIQYGVRQCLNENVTAILCGSPEIALYVCKVLARMQISIPDEISLIVVGNSPFLTMLETNITSVQLPSKVMTHDAVCCLVDLIEEDKKDMELVREFSPTVIDRASIVRPIQQKHGEKIVVVGSMNTDTMVEVSKIPIDGETQLAEKLFIFPGGKGGNQAVGAGKLGGQVYMIGRLGNDIDSKQLYSSLCENHVHMDGVVFDTSLPSGKAYINVDKNGESTIVVYQGANQNLSIEQLNQCRHLFQSAKYCLLSLEIPQSVAEYTIKLCKRTDTLVVLKPSAADKLKEEMLQDIAYFIPNENELHTFVKGSQSMEEKAQSLLDKGVQNIIVTMGKKGCYFKNTDFSMYFEGSGFEAVDSTGGADSFISALAVCLSEGKDIISAIGFAIYASGICVTRYGVQPALPDRKAVEIYEDEIYSKYLIKQERSN